MLRTLRNNGTIRYGNREQSNTAGGPFNVAGGIEDWDADKKARATS